MITPTPQTQDTGPLLELCKVSKVYYSDTVQTHALVELNLQVNRGDYVALMGPSGSGKSTLMAILGLLDTPTEGDYRMDGQTSLGLNEDQRASMRNQYIGFVFQSFNLIGDLTVAENVALPLRYRGGISKQEQHERVMTLLARVGMEHRAQHFPAQLSGGQAQRVAVARAFIGSPSIILADEPTGNLDTHAGEQVMALMEEARRENGTTLFLATHDPAHAERAQRVLHLLDGRFEDR
ncbi:ABC transporter ATP-binding protein [Acidithiobacillus acidisediminis]|uniref:ABC transporter ATP-binding protein n=1 Tax=Acidithiobacillus acidisediminis TaxID=2937799 RepID=UPI00200E84BC|nr:ABC transporter ATP-binding protein [Acidithiobacillus sp. S30A2]